MVVLSIIVLVAAVLWTAFVVSDINKVGAEQDERLDIADQKFEAMVLLVKNATKNYQLLEDAVAKDMEYIKTIHNKTMDEFKELKDEVKEG